MNPPTAGASLLTDVRVLEVGGALRSRYCGRLLSDLGASVQVIRLEDVPDLAPSPNGWFDLFLDEGKQQLFSLDSAAGQRPELAAVIRESDIVIEGVEPASAWHACLARHIAEAGNSRLIHLSLTPFGASGPASGWTGSDLNAFHFSGAGHRYLGRKGQEPLHAAGEQAEHWCALNGAFAAVVALVEQRRSGLGQMADVSSAESLAILLTAYGAITHDRQRREAGLPPELAERPSEPRSGLHKCRDGWVMITPLERAQLDALLRLAKAPDWVQQFSGTAYERAQYQDAIDMVVEQWTAERTRMEVAEACRDAAVPCAPMNTMADLAAHPQFAERSFFRRREDGNERGFLVPAPPFTIDGRRPASNAETAR